MLTDLRSGAIGGGAGAAVTFVVSAGLVYEITAAMCSSPQTTEINADKRAPTLMKWVNQGMLQSAVFVGITAYLSPEPWAAIAGGGLAAAVLYLSYVHAKQAGVGDGKPGTESY